MIPGIEDPEDLIIHQQELAELGNAILKLSDKYKDVLYFKYILELHDREIADILNISPDSVRQYLTRARRKAKELIGKELNQRAE